MKKILGLTISALLVIGAVGGGTYAFFTDTESSPNNTLTAGTLDLNIDGGDIGVTTLSVGNVAPGDSGGDNSTLTNSGSLSGELDISTSAAANTPGGGGGEYEGGSGELGASANITMFIDVDQDSAWSSGDIGLKSDNTTYSHPTALAYDTIDNFASKSWNAVETMVATASDDFTVLWEIPTDVDNTIQGDSVSVNVTFVLEQAAVD